jgi:predicted Holliday junction resolvase-like endonuclease
MTEIIQNNGDYVIGTLILICEISAVVIVHQFIKIKELKKCLINGKPKIKKPTKEQLEALLKNASNNRLKSTPMENIISKIERNSKCNKN